MGDIRRNTSFSNVGRENDVFFKYDESDRRNFFFRRTSSFRCKTRVIYYLLVLILCIELYTIKSKYKKLKIT